MKKLCVSCKQDRLISEFYKDKSRKDGLHPYCKGCFKKRFEKLYLLKRDEICRRCNEYRHKNKEKTKEINAKAWAKYYQKNKEKIKAYNMKYRLKNIEKYRELSKNYFHKRKQKDPLFKLACTIRSRMLKLLHRKQQSTIEILGCNWGQLKEHLESQFKLGMTWDNRGLFGWHIDHIIPLSSAKNMRELERLCHYTNLQPLWAKENRQKGVRYA